MKPRIYKRNGLWYCCRRNNYAPHLSQHYGMGYTPLMAYLDWLKAPK